MSSAATATNHAPMSSWSGFCLINIKLQATSSTSLAPLTLSVGGYFFFLLFSRFDTLARSGLSSLLVRRTCFSGGEGTRLLPAISCKFCTPHGSCIGKRNLSNEVHGRNAFSTRRHLYTERKRRDPKACRVLEERVNGEPSLGELRGKRLAWQPCCSVISALGRRRRLGFGPAKGNLGRRGKSEEEKEEKQCEAQVISVCLVRCEGRMLMSFIAEGRWRWVVERCAFRERLFLRWCVWGCFSPPPARPAAHSLPTTTGTSRAVPQCLRAFGLPLRTRRSPSPRSGGLLACSS